MSRSGIEPPPSGFSDRRYGPLKLSALAGGPARDTGIFYCLTHLDDLPTPIDVRGKQWGLIPSRTFVLQGQDLNLRPLGYDPSELPNCSTLR